MNPVTRFAAITLSAIVLLILCALMDGPSELETAQAVADGVTEMQYQAIADSGGVEFCKQFGRVPVMLPSGDLICRTAKRPAVTLAQGGA